MPYTEEELQIAKMKALNDATQDAARALLKTATIVKDSCRCEGFSHEKCVAILEGLAYELDKRAAMWSWNVELHAKKAGITDPRVIAYMADLANKANEGRLRVSKPSNWREVLGFAPGELPSEDRLKEAFRHKAKETHPDTTQGDSELFAKVSEANVQAKSELFGRSSTKSALSEKETTCQECGKLKA